MSLMCTRVVVLSCALFLASCASTYRVVQIPERAADMYPQSQTREGLTIAIDEIRSPGRVRQYFGADLTKAGIMPVLVVVSNYGKQRVAVKPADILLHRGREIVDPLPLEAVLAIATDRHWFLRKRTRERIETFFRGLAFRETILLPNDTYQGVMFFAAPRPARREDRFFSMLSLFAESGPRIRVAVTDLDSSQRVHFGPFSLSSPQDTLRQTGLAGFESF